MRQNVIQLTDVFIDGGRWSTEQLWMTQSTLEQRRIDRTDVARGARNDWPWYAYKHAGNNQTVVGYVVDIYDLDVGHESRATGSDDVEKIGDIRRTPGGFVHHLCEVEWLEAVCQLHVNWRVVSSRAVHVAAHDNACVRACVCVCYACQFHTISDISSL